MSYFNQVFSIYYDYFGERVSIDRYKFNCICHNCKIIIDFTYNDLFDEVAKSGYSKEITICKNCNNCNALNIRGFKIAKEFADLLQKDYQKSYRHMCDINSKRLKVGDKVKSIYKEPYGSLIKDKVYTISKFLTKQEVCKYLYDIPHNTIQGVVFKEIPYSGYHLPNFIFVEEEK